MAKRGGFPGGMGMGNMNQLMKQAQRMQKQMEKTQKELEESVYEATAGGGVVKVQVSGKQEILSLSLAEEVVDPDDIEMLEDLIIVAVNDALQQMADDKRRKTRQIYRWNGRRTAVLMNYYSDAITDLIDEFSHLPGIGAKSAQKLAFHVINMPEDQVKKLADTILSAKKNIHYCKECCTLTDQEVCPICASSKRDHSIDYGR